MPAVSKTTIYIDADEEITAVIDKVRTASEKVVAVVLPKRAPVMHSIVNMKLLKRVAEKAKKHVVLITSEASIMPLAGAVGMHVARTASSKPYVPAAPEKIEETTDVDEKIDAPETEPELDPKASIGALAATPQVTDADASESAVNLDDIEDVPLKDAAKKPEKANKRLKVPNFESFRAKLFLAVGGVIVLVVLWFIAFKVMPHADVVVTTKTQKLDEETALVVDATKKTSDVTKSELMGIKTEVKKTDTTMVSATGQKDMGTKATGKMTLTNCIDDGAAHTVPAGTAFSSGGYSFVTDEAVTLDPALYSGNTCKSADFGQSENVTVTASQAGDGYNLNARSYTSSIAGITAYGSAMTGGTSRMVKVVDKQDLETAKQQIAQKAASQLDTLKAQLEAQEVYAMIDTYTKVSADPKATPAVGEEATDVTVSIETTHTLIGVKKAELIALLKPVYEKDIDTKTQQIAGDMLGNLTFRYTEGKGTDKMKIQLFAKATAQAIVDTTDFKAVVKGRKKGDAEDQLSSRAGIADVKVTVKPFWASVVPKNDNKITVTVKQSN